MAKKLLFEDLDNMLSEIDDRGSLITTNEFSKIDHYINSGNYILNAQLTGSLFGGFPNSRSVLLAGEPGCLHKDELLFVYKIKNPSIENKKLTNSDFEAEMIYNDHYVKHNIPISERWQSYLKSQGKYTNVRHIVEEDPDGIYFVDTPDEMQQIGERYIKNRTITQTVTKSGKSTKTSSDHMFETKDGFKKQKDLSFNDHILTKDGFEKIAILMSMEYQEDVYDFEVLHENHRYWTKSGMSSHNSGKTFVALNACANAQKMGYNIIYCDTEAAIDLQFIKKFGVDPDKFRYQPINTPREFSFFITNLIAKLKEAKKKKIETPKIMLVLDSIGNMATSKLKEDSITGSNKKDMTKQQELKALFSVTTMDLAAMKIPFIITSHTYANISSFFPSTTVSGGCLEYGTLIKTPGGYTEIQNLKIGDTIINSANKVESILETWKLEKEEIHLFFSDGYDIITSLDHRFLTGTDVNNDDHWTSSKDLNEGELIKTLGGEIHIEKKVVTGKTKSLYDISVPSKHYILENDIISHNSGGKYNTSVILKFHVAQLKDSNEKADRVGMKKSGIVVRSVPDKNRFARPITVRFHISFYQGMNPYVGLEEYINWDSVGIERGKLFGSAEFNKMTEEEQQIGIDNGTIWFSGEDDKNVHIFEPRKSSRVIVVKHLNNTVPASELFTPKVITEEILKSLDDNIIKDLFALPEIGDINLTDGLDEIALNPDNEIKMDELLGTTLPA